MFYRVRSVMSELNTREVGLRVLLARRRLNWRQGQLAEKAGISVMTVRRVERGIGRPDTATLTRIASALGVSFSSLVSTEGAVA